MGFGGNAGGWEQDEGVSASHWSVPGVKCQRNVKHGDKREQDEIFAKPRLNQSIPEDPRRQRV